MNHFDLSIVISTFNRERNVIEIINLLNKQNNFLKKNIEIIICDSNSKKRFSIINYLKQFNNLKILYFNCKVNHQAFKRNFGLKKSSSNSVIFIDDDCFPDVNFLFNYYRYLKLNKSKII
jgi:glycosyltransferase involved in cell wall biosynthesis